MSAIGNYVLTIIIVAFVCSILSDLIQNPASAAIIHMISGMILAITIFVPISNADLSSYLNFDISVMDEASAAVNEGIAKSQDVLYASIKQETESYIQEKAAAMGTQISAKVSLSNDDLPVPVSVVMSGAISPAVKQKLQDLIETQLGITKENTQWIG